MATHRLTEINRIAMAVLQANKTGDRAGLVAVLSQLKEDKDVVDFLDALANMVHFALAQDPSKGFQAFIDAYGASMDQVDAKLDEETST